MASILRPCPCCKMDLAELYEVTQLIGGHKHFYFIKCDWCELQTKMYDWEKDVIDAWNAGDGNE